MCFDSCVGRADAEIGMRLDTTVIAAGNTESLSGAVERGSERHARSEVRGFDPRKGTARL
jgi:hypothetical protein